MIPSLMKIRFRHHTLAALFLLAIFLPTIVMAQGLVPCTGNVGDECDFEDLITLISKVLEYLIYFVATPLAAIMFAVAGYYYLTAGEDAGKVKKAHDIFISVLWGFGIMLVAWALVSFIFNFFTDGSFTLLAAP